EFSRMRSKAKVTSEVRSKRGRPEGPNSRSWQESTIRSWDAWRRNPGTSFLRSLSRNVDIRLQFENCRTLAHTFRTSSSHRSAGWPGKMGRHIQIAGAILQSARG